MDLETVYNTKTVLLIFLTLVCVICGAGFLAYGISRLRRSMLSFASAAALSGVLSLPILGVLALASPNVAFQNFFAAALESAAILVGLPLLFILYGIYQSGGGWKIAWGYGFVVFIHTMCTISLLKNSIGIHPDRYYGFIADFICLSIFLFCGRHVLFNELSPFSIDRFMQDHDDAIIVFDKGGRLMEANKKADHLLPFLSEDISYSNRTDPDSQTEIVLTLPEGHRNFHLSNTPVRDKKGRVRAAVITLRDITEITLLERELSEKRNELEIMNRNLRDYLNAADKLLEEEQKTRMIQEIQETIGLKAEQLMVELDSAGKDADHDQIIRLTEKCRSIMNDVRTVVHQLAEYR